MYVIARVLYNPRIYNDIGAEVFPSLDTENIVMNVKLNGFDSRSIVVSSLFCDVLTLAMKKILDASLIPKITIGDREFSVVTEENSIVVTDAKKNVSIAYPIADYEYFKGMITAVSKIISDRSQTYEMPMMRSIIYDLQAAFCFHFLLSMDANLKTSNSKTIVGFDGRIVAKISEDFLRNVALFNDQHFVTHTAFRELASILRIRPPKIWYLNDFELALLVSKLDADNDLGHNAVFESTFNPKNEYSFFVKHCVYFAQPSAWSFSRTYSVTDVVVMGGDFP